MLDSLQAFIVLWAFFVLICWELLGGEIEASGSNYRVQ